MADFERMNQHEREPAGGRGWVIEPPKDAAARAVIAGGRADDAQAFVRDPDGWMVGYWLSTVASKSTETRRAYFREVRRFRGFLMALHGSRSNDLLAHATAADAGRYIAWLEGAGEERLPAWVGRALEMDEEQCMRPGAWVTLAAGEPDPRNPDVKLAQALRYKKPSPKVERQSVTVLFGMYNELMAQRRPGTTEPLCSFNPFQAWRKRVGTPQRRAAGIQKAMSDLAWSTLIDVANDIPDDPQQRLWALRRRLIFNMLRGSWDRRSAIAAATWADVSIDGYGITHLKVPRKGQVDPQPKPLPPSLAAELLAFRKEAGLPEILDEKSRGHSIFWFGGRSAGKGGPVHDHLIYREIKVLFEAAAQRLERAEGDAGLSPQELADRAAARQQLLRAGAGPHAIRHTMATQFMDSGGDPRVAQEILGHSSVAITTTTYDSKPVKRQARELQEQWERSERKGGSGDDEA